LEERLKRKPRDPGQLAGDSNVLLHFDVIARLSGEKSNELLDIEVDLSLDDLCAACLGLLQGSGYWSERLRERFPELVEGKIFEATVSQSRTAEVINASILRDEFEHVLHVFVAQKLLKIGSAGWTDSSGAWLTITDKGLHRLSEAKAKLRKTAAVARSPSGEPRHTAAN